MRLPCQILPLRDSARRQTNWNECVGPDQCAIFLSDIRTGSEVTIDGLGLPPGTPSSFLLFDSLEEAKTFCHERVAANDHVCCDIYDHRGNARGPLARIMSPRFARRVPGSRAAKAMIVAAVALIAVSPLLFWWDWRSSGILVLPTLLGLNCIIMAGRLFYLAAVTFQKLRLAKQDKT